jgi:hypothetical protein
MSLFRVDREVTSDSALFGCKTRMGQPEITPFSLGNRSERDRLVENRHLQRLAESIHGNTGEPSRDDKESEQVRTKELTNPPRPKKAVRVAIVLRIRESRIHGEGPQHVGALEATYLNANTEVHL